MSNDDYVAASVKLVDIFAAFYVTERFDYLENGITTTYMALSNLMTLVTSTEKAHTASWWNFGVPYSNNMWLCIFFVMVFHGFCQVAIIKKVEYDPGKTVRVVMTMMMISSVDTHSIDPFSRMFIE